MKRLAFLIALLLLPCPVMAAEDPEIIVIDLVDQNGHIYAPSKQIVACHQYEWTDEEIDAVAAIYWAETGRGEKANREKLYITQLIYNRTQYGDPFPADIVGVCKQKGEFNRGRVSDRNRELARLNLNKVKSQAEGFYQGIEMWTSAIYMAREGGTGILTFLDDCWVPVFRVE